MTILLFKPCGVMAARASLLAALDNLMAVFGSNFLVGTLLVLLTANTADGLSIDPKFACDPSSGPTSVV
jgi:hypothetical protein